MPRKEKTNAKTWERDRRNRMNTYFKTLSDLLPPQQEGRKRNKVDILIHASKYIKELNNRTDELFGTHTSDAHKDELNRLKKLVTQLLSRTQLLSALLRDAGISVPAEPMMEKMSPLKWSNKINVEESDKYIDRLSERKKPDKRKSKQIGYKVPSKQKIVGLVNDTPKKVPDAKEILDCDLIEDQENHVNSSVNETCKTRDAAAGGSDETEESAAALQHDATAPPLETAVSKPSKRIRKLESRKKVKRKGKIIDSKMKKKKIHVASSQSQSIANLLPGTLIWSAGKIVPLVTPITSLTPNILVSAQAQSSNPIILGNAQQNQMIVMQSLTNRVQSSVLPVRNDTLVKAVQKVALNGVTSVQTSLGMNSRDWSMKNIIEATKISGRKVILPKSKEITTTTMTYKVPIPAIHREPPTSKLVESIDHQSSRKSKKIVKNKKPQKSENPEAEVKESLDKNGATSDKVDEVETTKLPEESSSPGVSANAEIIEKKRKANQDPSLPEVQPAKIAKVARSPPLSCKSTENLKNLVEISAESTSEITDKTKKPESYRAADDSNKSRISLNKSPAMPECTSETENANVSQSQGSDTSKPSASELENSTKNSEDTETMRPPTESKSTNDWSQKLDNRMLKEPTDNESSTENERTWKSSANTENVETAALLEVNERIAEAVVVSEKDKNVCDLRTRFDSLLRATESTDAKIDENGIAESAKIILNLDTNTTTTMKPEACATSVETLNTSVSGAVLTSTADIVVDEARINDRTKADETLKSLSYSSVNSFVPIGNNRADGLHSDLSNDLFASLQVPSSSHNPESISPTAAFLMAFPLVSSLNGKTEVLEEEMKEDLKYHSQTPPMLLQIGAIEPNSFKVKNDSPTASALPVPDKTNSHQESQNAKILHRSASEVSKAQPKIINNETIKEPLFKVVLYPETSLVSSENFAPVPSNARPSNSVNTTLANGDIQTTSITEASNVAITISVTESSLATVTEGVAEKGDVSARKNNEQQAGNVSLIAKYEETNSERTIVSSNCTSDSSKYETAGRYPTLPDYVPSYTNFPTSSSQQSRLNYGASKNAMVNTSGNSTQMAGLESATMAYPSMIRSQAVQSAYVAHTTGKEVVESMYPNHRRKDASLVNPPEAVTSYVAFPSVSQNLQHDYLSRSKETYQSYGIHGKENNAVAPFQGYSVASGKSSSIHDTSQQERTYVASRINDNVKEPLNAFHSYPTLAQSSKESTGQRVNSETSGRLNSRESQRPVEASSRSSSNGKIDNFAQSASYSNFSKDSKNDILSAETMFQQAKRNDSQNYVTYIREAKKTIYDPSPNSSIPQTSKSQIIANSTIPRYGANQLHAQLQQQPQQQQACVVTSNYAPSTTTSDNTVKSTTTVAHNSSNFSILSWTTFSPIGASSLNNNTAVNSGNANNHVHYEPGADHASEPTGPKTCCENYAYAPIHKDSSYSNILPSEGFNGDSTLVEKPRDKLINESQKPAPQIFEDSAKAKNIQSIPTEHKIVRSHNQTGTTTTDYKYVGENKSNKPNNKYPMGSAYTQTEFASLEPQQTTKAPQPVTGKPDKSNYPMPTYDSQASFDIAENNVTIKCSNNSEIYTSSSYKYIEDKDASLQLKYQPHAQTQATILHHDGTNYSSVKHVNQQQVQQPQQQQSIPNKSKTIEQQQQQPQQQHQQQHQQQQQQLQQQQQQPVRPPVNWMMTPEIKHSTNIADLILPPIGKELEFCQNSIFAQPSTYNQTTSNHQFYNNYDTTVSAPHGFPNIPTLQTDPRRIPDSFYTEEQAFSWSPTKTSQIEHNSMQKSIDQHVVVPSTLPTLVGDLALGTNISEKQSFLFGQMAPPRANKDMIQTPASNAQNSQQSVQGSSFLSVSQLVENEKAEKSHQQQNHHSHNPNDHHHHHHHTQQQHQQQSSHQASQQQARKHQRKNVAASPRATGKRQIEARKPTAAPSVVVDQLHGQTTEEQKLPTSHPVPEQQAYHHHHHHHHQQHQQQQQHQHSLQTQKFQQNDVHWRNRQCKSNYTAEALIGGNTSIHDNNNSEKPVQASTIKSFTSEYPQNKYPAGLGTTEMIMPTINYLSNPSDDQNSYGQTVNQNFNPSSYAYSSNTNIYPTTNFITSISNTSTSYMMPSLHENPSDFIEANSFLLPNVTSSSTKTTVNVSPTTSSTATSTRLVTSSSLSATANSKNQQQQYTSSSNSTSNLAKNQNCEKRNSYASTSSKKSKRKTDNGGMHSLEFPISTVGSSQIDDYHAHPHHHHHHHHHSHPSSFLAPPHANPLYQNHSHTSSSVGLMANSNRMARTGILSNNPSLGHHHPSGTSLTNFNLSTIFPEINDKVTGYKPSNVIPPGLSQASNHPTVTYPQRGNYATADTLGHVAQEPSQFTSDLPAAPPPGVLHYKTT